MFSKKLTIPNAGKDTKQQEWSFIVDDNEKWYSYFRRQWQFFLKLSIVLPYYPAIMLRDIFKLIGKLEFRPKPVPKCL